MTTATFNAAPAPEHDGGDNAIGVWAATVEEAPISVDNPSDLEVARALV